MPRLPGRVALAACALWLGGCVDGSLDGSSLGAGTMMAMSGSAGSSGTDAGASTGGGGAGGGAASIPSSGSSAGGAVACTDYTDATGWKLHIRILNQRTETLYLGPTDSTCSIERIFKVEDGARTVLPNLEGCHTSCQAMMDGGAMACPEVCAAPATVTLTPGQQIDLMWDGRFGVDETLPQQCMRAPQAAGSCVRAEQVEAGPYTFSAQAGTQRVCTGPTGVCDCAPNQYGGCTSPNSVAAGTIYTTERFMALEPGELSPAGEPPYIELLFK